MRNVMEFDGGYKAVIAYDPEIEMFRGEFIGLNGSADFYAVDAAGLKAEGQKSLEVFLRLCAEDGVPPRKARGKFALRLDPETREAADLAAAARGMSVNQWITQAIRSAARDQA